MMKLGCGILLFFTLIAIIAVSVFALRINQVAQNGSTLDFVSRKCFFDIEIDGAQKVNGRIVFGLFGDTVPITARNFAKLCSGVNGVS